MYNLPSISRENQLRLKPTAQSVGLWIAFLALSILVVALIPHPVQGF